MEEINTQFVFVARSEIERLLSFRSTSLKNNSSKNKNMKNRFLAAVFIITVFLVGLGQTAAAANWGVGVDLGGGSSVYVGEGNTPMNNGGWAGINNNFGLPGGTLLGILQSLLMWLLAIFAILGIIAFVISGIMYLTAAGDASAAGKAKTNMQWAILGIIVGLSGFIILTAVNTWLKGGNNF